MKLLQQLEDANAAESTAVKLDDLCYRYVLQTISRKSEHSQLGEMADEVIRKMREAFIVPDAFCFTYAIKTWKNAALHTNSTLVERETSVRRALELLGDMDVAHNQSTSLDVLVSTENATDVLEALTVSDNPRRAEFANKILSKMEDESRDKHHHLIPSSKIYMFAIRIWRSIWSSDRIEKSQALLNRMVQHVDVMRKRKEPRNDLVLPFNEFILVCASQRVASQSEGLDVLRHATNAVKSLRTLDKVSPNASTYAALLGSCTNLLNNTPERSEFVKKIFGQCCVEGMVDEEVLQKLKAAISAEEYSDLVVSRSEEVDGEKIVPESWSVKTLRGSTITADGRRSVPLTIDGNLTFTKGMVEFQMRRLREKRNQRLLRGGRYKPPERTLDPTWTLY